MQPDSFPGRTTGIAGIQTIPFNQSVGRVTRDWVDRVRTYGKEDYRVDFSLVESLIKGTYPSIGNDGGFWGTQALLFLSRGSEPSDFMSLYDTALERNLPLKQWESYSNILYFLGRRDRPKREIAPLPPAVTPVNTVGHFPWVVIIISIILVIVMTAVIIFTRKRR
jgi:hypothetical protein